MARMSARSRVDTTGRLRYIVTHTWRFGMGAVFRTRGSAGGVLVPALLGALLLLTMAGSRAPLLASSQQAESFEALGLQLRPRGAAADRTVLPGLPFVRAAHG